MSGKGSRGWETPAAAGAVTAAASETIEQSDVESFIAGELCRSPLLLFVTSTSGRVISRTSNISQLLRIHFLCSGR